MLGLQLPRTTRAPRILCLGAHSDDIEIGCGGTLAALARKRPRPEFRWVVWSAPGQRAREAARGARKFLGTAANDAVRLHEFRDGFFPSYFDAIKDAFEGLAREFRPDVVFTHARDDRHQDHRVVSDLTWNTFRDQLVLEYEIPKWDGDLGRPRVTDQPTGKPAGTDPATTAPSPAIPVCPLRAAHVQPRGRNRGKHTDGRLRNR